MKLIKMRTLAAGPDGTLDPGKTYPVNDKAAAALVDGGFADYAEPPRLEKATRPLEPERAVKPEAVHIGGGWYEYEGKKLRKNDLPKGVL